MSVVMGGQFLNFFVANESAKASSNVEPATTKVSSTKGSLSQMVNDTWSGDDLAKVNQNDQSSSEKAPETQGQAQQIGQLIADHAVVKHSGEDTVVTITDSSVDAAYESVLENKPYTELRSGSQKTKIVWHGAAKKGNFDVYLSAKWLNRIKSGSISVGVTVVMTALALPLGPISGIAWKVVNGLLKKLVGSVISAQGSKFKKGRLFKVRGMKYKGWSYQ